MSDSLASLGGTGYGEKDFSHFCVCGGELNHPLLRVSKFKKDAQNLLLRDWPLSGTVLSKATGVVSPIPVSEAATSPGTFPNRVITLGIRQHIPTLLDRTAPRPSDICNLYETTILDRGLVRKINDKKSIIGNSQLAPGERLAIRKVMSRYWDNASTFSMDLASAVIRQGTFVEKMHNIDWLHSPTVATTMARLLQKYERFFQIMAEHPGQVAVPTLDVDLAWHTHQCGPEGYYDWGVERTSRFVDHDDKIDEDRLSVAFEWTSKCYEKMFGEVYSECTCWYCEGASPLPSSCHSILLSIFHRASSYHQIIPPIPTQ